MTGLPEIPQSVEELRFLNNKASADLVNILGDFRKLLQSNDITSTQLQYFTQVVIETRDVCYFYLNLLNLKTIRFLKYGLHKKLLLIPNFHFLGKITIGKRFISKIRFNIMGLSRKNVSNERLVKV
jgi:hypothetical protein